MLILDTAGLPVAEGFEAFHAAAVAGTGSCGVGHEDGLEGVVRWRMNQWRFGPITMHTADGPGIRYWQTTRHLRMDSWNTITAMTQARGRAGFTWNDHRQDVGSGDLVLTNKSAGFWEYHWAGSGETLTFLVDADQVGLPERMVHAAMPRVGLSSITPLLLNQMRALHKDADLLADASADAVGESTVTLVRALIASVGAVRKERREIAEETRLVRILAHIRAHLADPSLSAASIAAAHNLSLRSLYRLCEDGGVRLEPWIIRQRLEGAGRDLVASGRSHQTIESIARAWGFTSPSHFTRRFSRAYGMSPRAWRNSGGTGTGT